MSDPNSFAFNDTIKELRKKLEDSEATVLSLALSLERSQAEAKQLRSTVVELTTQVKHLQVCLNRKS